MNSSKTPKIYYKFKAKDKDSDELIDYRIQDLPEELYEKAIELFLTDFIPDDILCASREVSKNQMSIEDSANLWRQGMQQRLILSCFRDNDIENEEIVAVNILYIASKHSKDESKYEFKSQDIKDIIDVMAYALDTSNIYDTYGVNEFLGGFGLVVNCKYRGRGIATEMLKARKPFLKATGFQLTSTAFTGIGSQKAAKYAGYDENYSISYNDLANISSNFRFTKDLSKHLKIMSFKL